MKLDKRASIKKPPSTEILRGRTKCFPSKTGNMANVSTVLYYRFSLIQ